VNSRKDIFIIKFISLKQNTFEIVNIKRISKKTLIKQDLSIIKERVRLYTYIILILVLNKVKLSILLFIY